MSDRELRITGRIELLCMIDQKPNFCFTLKFELSNILDLSNFSVAVWVLIGITRIFIELNKTFRSQVLMESSEEHRVGIPSCVEFVIIIYR